jgi:predicted chitinase
MITKSLLVDSKTCSEDMADKWIDALNQVCEKYEINTALRIAGFLSQCGHESGGFRYTVENFNYSAARLLMVFPHYFNADSAKNYEYKPEKIANRVYANRMGNEDEASGDGWQYRGRGLIQLTGKDSYAAFSMAAEIERDLISQRTKEALQFKKEQGMKLGRPKGVGKSKLDAFKPEIESLLANGSTQKFVAKRYKTTEANLHNWLKKNNLMAAQQRNGT